MSQPIPKTYVSNWDDILKKRIFQVIEVLREKNLDTFMVLKGENRQYLSGFTGQESQLDESAGALFITEDRLVLATDSRYVEQAENEAPLYDILCYRKELAKELPAIVSALNTKRLGFESSRVSCLQLQNMKKALQSSGATIEMIFSEDIIENIRMVKSPDEIDKIKKAISMAESAFSHLLKVLKTGLTEKEVAWTLEKTMRELGADAVSFPTIVASGPNSALPHAHPGDRKIGMGEPILFDWGARINGYCSDISRTLFSGKPTDPFKTVFQTVLDAQSKAIDAIRPGVSVKNIDGIAREHIHAKGFKNKFGHSLGHGTGLAVHERPRLSSLSDTILREGTVVTVEPGIYLPGWGGVRIENQVVVGNAGADVLNRLGTNPLLLFS